MTKYALAVPALLLAAGMNAADVAAPPAMTLAQATEMALKNNLRAQIARERGEEARAQRGMGRSALLPNISGAAYQMNLTMNLAASGLVSTFPGIPAFIGPFSRFDARFELVQSVFNLSSIRRYQASRLGVKLADQQQRVASQQVMTMAALSYIAVLEADHSVAAAEANVQLARALLDLAVNQKKAGIATGLDVTRAETRLAGQEVQLARARTSLDTARLNLLRTIGSPLGGSVVLADQMKFEPRRNPLVEDVVRQAFENRAELQAAEEQLRIAEAERKAAIGGWVPSVTVFGDYGNSGLRPDQVDLPTRSIGIRLDVPIFNGGRTRAEVQLAGSHVREAELQLADLRAAVEKDVRQALDELATRETQMKAASKGMDLAERELSLAQDRFRNGAGDNIEVTTAQTALETARQAVVSSLAQFNLARLNLYSAMGRTEDFAF